MLVKHAGRCAARLGARCYWRRFRIDDAGHGDWEGTPEQRTIQIRFSSVPESMIDALHGLRAIERQFGRLRDYRLLRDSELRSAYQAICWAAFESPGSLLRVPSQGTTLRVTLPPPLGRPDGGLGLDDIKSLLVPHSSSSQDEPRPCRFVTLAIKRAGPITYRSTTTPPRRSRAMKAAIGHAFLEWGGFAPLRPLHATSPYISPARDLAPLDSINMRLALNKWSQILGVNDPLFPEMRRAVDESETRGRDWEPLSQPRLGPDVEADAAEGVEVPQESLKQSLEGLLQRSQLRRATKGTDDDSGRHDVD